jgi:hypothetical protein
MQQRIQAEKSKSGGMDGGLGTASEIGLDLGDKWSRYCVLDHGGVILEEDRVRTGAESLRERFGRLPPTRMVIEAGAHSPWVSRLLESIGQLSGTASAAVGIRRQRAATGDHQSWQRTSAPTSGAERAVHAQFAGPGQSAAKMGTGAGFPRG